MGCMAKRPISVIVESHPAPKSRKTWALSLSNDSGLGSGSAASNATRATAAAAVARAVFMFESCMHCRDVRGHRPTLTAAVPPHRSPSYGDRWEVRARRFNGASGRYLYTTFCSSSSSLNCLCTSKPQIEIAERARVKTCLVDHAHGQGFSVRSRDGRRFVWRTKRHFANRAGR